MSTVTWLHISDLHLRESQGYNTNIVLTALLRDLANREQIASELRQIDFIVVTGDIAFASRPEEYMLACQFFDDLLRTTGVRKSRLFVVPGNHDIDRNAISEDAQKIATTLIDRDAVNRFLDDEVARAVVFRRFHRYQRFVTGYLGKCLVFDSVRYFGVWRPRRVAGKQIVILGLNSAWLSASDADRNRLLLGERQVRTALQQANSADIRIAIMHHPFEWLQDFDRDDCEPLLLRGCDFVLHGHLHRTGLIRLRAPGIEAMVIAGGACYEARQYPNTCNLVHLDFRAGKGTVFLRRYSDQQGGFWTKDLLTYPEAPGEYHIDLPHQWTVEERPKLITVGRKLLSDKWWQKRGYIGDPFVASNAEDADVEQLRDWHIDCLSLADRRTRGIDTLDAVIREGDSSLGLIYAPPGGGKTFYRRLATQWCREEIETREVLEIGVTDLHQARVPGRDDLSAYRLAVCVRNKIFASHPRRSSVVDTSLSDTGSGPGYVLSQCATLATSLKPEYGFAKVYIFLDDLDKIYHKLKPDKRKEALEEVADFLADVAGGACGEFMAMRIFLPLELYEPIQRALTPHLTGRIYQERLLWTLESCLEVAERRLHTAWSSEAEPRVGHLAHLLSQDAMDLFRHDLRKRQRQGTLSPRDAIKMLSSVANYGARRGIKTEPVSADMYRQSWESSKVRPWPRPFRKPWL